MLPIYTSFDGSIAEAQAMYKNYYKDEAFVFVSDKNIHLKQIVNTNNCLLYLEKQGNKLMIISCTDNLLKGASGQALQNMNLIFGLKKHLVWS
ncbi:MAG: hypothetical protein R2801_05635 [Chitinophagales bacterium]